jgi:hypothetical protein
MTHDTQNATAEASVVREAALSREECYAARRQNLIMLTHKRGSKSALNRLAGLTNSRTSLMTTGQRPVSDIFARAIETALDLPKCWLDLPRREDEIPATARALLGDVNAQVGDAAADIAAQLAYGRTIGQAAESRAAISPLFEKVQGRIGPIAEALAKTILKMSAAEQLSESKAFQLLGVLIEECGQTD